MVEDKHETDTGREREREVLVIRNLNGKDSIGPEIVRLTVVRVDERHGFVRRLGGEDIGQRHVLVTVLLAHVVI